jgi:hypothetical protein
MIALCWFYQMEMEMDAAHKSNRRFPGHTDAELEAAVARQTDPVRREAMETELANRRAGISKPFATPQIGGGTPIVGRFKS